ncbi:unnamed protein product [Meganyctiphanes norvegica]|uniref:Oplophorus-luciferin 2-monooxygenase non-catalytic subunit n=1 Tax=Meganyctiphanes norvegica TaxID=48144 RepID=A0AAV2RWI9_MEGNR
MLGVLYLVALFCIQQNIVLVDSISINTNMHQPLSSPKAVAKQVWTGSDSYSINNITKTEDSKARSQDESCPAEEDIAPCVCSIIEDNIMNMVCSDVATEDELREIFTSYFPNPHFDMFTTYDCPLKVLESGVFGEVTFKHISMGYGALTEVESGALDGMYDTLEELRLDDNHIESFPFEIIESFTKLQIFSIDNNWEHMTVFPIIKSASINTLYLANGKFDVVPIDAFQGLPMIEELYIYSDKIPSIESGTFGNLTQLRMLDLKWNLLTHLHKGIFHFSDDLDIITYIALSGNQIETIEANAFDAVAGVSIQLFGNNLATLDEEVWESLFDVGIDLDVSNNPLICGCDIAWVVRNPDYMAQIWKDATCSDGVYLHDLDPAMFVDC